MKFNFFQGYLEEKQREHPLDSLFPILITNQKITNTFKTNLDLLTLMQLIKKNTVFETTEVEEEQVRVKLLVG